jgi:hypothetical protein
MIKEIGVIALFTVPAIVYQPKDEPPTCAVLPATINVVVQNKADARFTEYKQCPIIKNEARC